MAGTALAAALLYSKKKAVSRMLRLRVKEVADAKRISRTKLSQRAEISYNTIKEIFRDPYRIITTETLQRIADALGVPVTELIEDVPLEQWEREKGSKG